jgi:hypothetical protein
MENDLVDIFVEDDLNQTFLIVTHKSIKYCEFQNLLKEKKIIRAELTHYYIVLHAQKYNKQKLNEVLNFENGDRVTIINTRIPEKFEFHTDPNAICKNTKIVQLSGFMRLFLIKYISIFVNPNFIQNPEIREIIMEIQNMTNLAESPKGPEEGIQSILKDETGNDMIAYSKYVNSVINDQELNKLIELAGPNNKEYIRQRWCILSDYEEINKYFEENLVKTLENSYFDYSLINLSMYQQDKTNYLKSMAGCSNLIRKYLFHGTQIDPISKIITTGFAYARKAFFGMGVYFTDLLDYASFYCGGNNMVTRRDFFGKTLPVNTTFSCVGAEVYYAKDKIKYIFDYSYNVDELNHFPTYEELKTNYRDKMIPQYGVHIATVEPDQGHVRKKEEIISAQKEGKFYGTDYAITEKNQILPLYGLTFKRNEYFVIWRDPNFSGQNDFSNFLKERQLFIYKYAKMTAYFVSSTEKALEIIKRKRFNKIILISSIGLDLSGKKFVEIARQILGFNIVVLFFSRNQKHFSWLQSFPNALYTNDANFYKEYIMNYNYNGLLNLKKKIENYYGINLLFTNDFFKFSNFQNQVNYSSLTFFGPNKYFKKVVIKLRNTIQVILYMAQNGTIGFVSPFYLDNSCYWYITMMGNEITFYSNGRYLGANLQQRQIISDQYMQRFMFTKINNTNDEYVFYYQNQNNILTANGNFAILHNYTGKNQIFKLVELCQQ